MINKTIKIPWYIILMDSMIIFNNPIQKYINRQMDKQPEVLGEDEFINSLPKYDTQLEVIPSCKTYEQWLINKFVNPGWKDYFLDWTIEVIKPYDTEETRNEYREYYKEYRKELRDWYNKRKDNKLKIKENVKNN